MTERLPSPPAVANPASRARWRPVRGALGVLLAVLAAGCAAGGGGGSGRYATAVSFAPQRVPSYVGLPLASGQLVLSEAPSALNLVIALLPETYRPFVHAGILSFEDGAPYVYEAIGAWGIPFGRRPTDAIGGAIQRVPLEKFLANNDFVEFYDPPATVDLGKMVAFAQHHYRAKTPFDAYFNAYDHRKLYCAEFVALALEHSGAAPVPVSKMRANHSVKVALEWLGIHAERHYQAADLIVGATPVAALSRRHTLTQARVHFAVRREIHRRFTSNQRLGHVITRTSFGIEERKELRRFEAAAQQLFPPDAPTPTQASADEAVQRLADRVFGVLPLPGINLNPPSAERLRPRTVPGLR